jgi:diacylglycerol kinase (ATP)
MRVAAIFGLGCSPKLLRPFQTDESIEWHMGMPAASEQADVILLFGGDGTIHRHLHPLVELEVPVLIVPTGSGNDFARALGLKSLRDSLAAWQRFRATRDSVRAIDLGVVTPLGTEPDSRGRLSPQGSVVGTRHYFCSVAGVGLDAEVTRRANKLPRWIRGHGGYAFTVLPTIFGFSSLPIRISTQGADGNWSVQSDGPTLMAAFANSAIYGGGMKIAPQAKMDDGQLDVCVIGRINPFKLACMFPTIYFGRHLKIREVEYFQAARVRVETETPLDIYADGEFVCCTPAEVGIQRAALKVLTL